MGDDDRLLCRLLLLETGEIGVSSLFAVVFGMLLLADAGGGGGCFEGVSCSSTGCCCFRLINMSRLVCFSADGGVAVVRGFLDVRADGVVGAPPPITADDENLKRDVADGIGVEVDCVGVSFRAKINRKYKILNKL